VTDTSAFGKVSLAEVAVDGDARAFVEGIENCFSDLKDPRIVASCDHRLLDIVVITILAVLSGADDWTDLQTFGEVRHAWLKTFLALPHGIPSHDTFRRVFGLLDPRQFAACLFRWTQAIQEATGGKLISIDGKTLRRSFAKRSGKAALHLVTAWSGENGLTLGQVACEEKSNEITAIPELLKLLSLRGCTVTIDAMGCQKEIAAGIRGEGGHFVLALKGNQPGLEADMHELYFQAIDSDFAHLTHAEWEATETAHGRTETRNVHVLVIPKDHPQRRQWKDLHTLAVITTCRRQKDQENWETRWYVSSHPPRAGALAGAIRKHWGIENGQHWVLDVAFDEDRRRQQDRRGAVNLAAVRRLAVSLLRQDKSLKRGAKCKRMACALNPSYLLRVLHNAKIDA
jgi:predicted transposase YbfD/YdcC